MQDRHRDQSDATGANFANLPPDRNFRFENCASVPFDGNQVLLSAQLRNTVFLAGVLALTTEVV
jgi:hypothetical protein